MLQMFYSEVRTKDGLEYEPESLKSMLAVLDRHLKEHGCLLAVPVPCWLKEKTTSEDLGNC